MTSTPSLDTDPRALAQERMLNALIAVAATRDPGLIEAMRNALVDTNFSRGEPPAEGASVLQHISYRLNAIQAFAEQMTGGAFEKT